MNDRNPSGAVHPTVFLVLWIVLGIGMHRIVPLEFTKLAFLQPLQLALLMPGVLLFAWSGLELHRHKTTMDHKDATTTLVTSGPYRFSRNPIYVALILSLLGLRINGGDLWFLLLTLAFWAAVQRFTIVKEEAYLEREFGEEYSTYRETVRRWI